MDFDNVLPHIGDRQQYQQLIFYALAIPCTIMSVTVMFNVLFISATPDHWCRVPELEQTGLSFELRRNISIPWEMRDGVEKPSRCKMYDVNYTAFIDLFLFNETFVQNASLPQVSCKFNWEYDKSIFHSTLVTEMNVVCDKSWLAKLAMSAFYAGSLVGNLIFGYIGDRFGRKPTLISIILMDVIIGFASAFSPNYLFYIVCRAILGLGFPSLYRLAFIIAMELMVPKRRARCGMLYCIFFSLAMTMLAGIAYLLRSWFHLSLVTSLPFIGLLVYWWFITESPRWYLSHNHFEKAEIVIRKIANFNGKKIPEGYLQNLFNTEDVANQPKVIGPKPSLLDLVKTPNLRKKFFIINFVWIVIAFDYSGLSLGSTSLGVNDYLAFTISALVEIPGISVAWFLMEKIGRRWVMFFSMIIGGVSLISTGFIPASYIWTTFVLSNIGKFGISASFSVIYVFASELVPTVLRSLALATCSFTSGFGLISAPLLLHLSELYGKVLPLMVFGILSLAGGFLILLLPETLNTHLPQTVEESENFGRKFRLFSCPVRDHRQETPKEHHTVPIADNEMSDL